MPFMQQQDQNNGLATTPSLDPAGPQVPPSVVPGTVPHHRSDDELEAESIKYNVARIVRLSSGRFALFSHYRAGSLDIIKVGTIEEIVDHIPDAAECAFTPERTKREPQKLTIVDLADLGL